MASPDPTVWSVASLSDTGRVRSDNEDRCGTFENAAGARLLVVADGMGGHRGGATASQLAIEALEAALVGAEDVSGDWLAETIGAANLEVYARAERDAELLGMGTTLVAILVAASGQSWVANVGDSRAYRLRGGTLEQLTEDHSVVAEMIRRGVITPEEAETHPRRNEILRSIGVEVEVEPDVGELDLRAGDRLLLCSDGLCGVVSHDEIAQQLTAHTVIASVEHLVETANQLGGPDNITAVIAEVPAGFSTAKRRAQGSALALALLVVLVAGLGVFAFQLWR